MKRKRKKRSSLMSLKDNIKKKEIITIIGSVICFFLFSLSAKYTGINLNYIVNFQNHFIKFMMIGTSKMTMESALFLAVSSFISILIALVLLVAGFAILSSYGFLENNRMVGLIAALISSLGLLVIFGFSIISVFVSLGLIIACMFIIPLANTYGKELKRWILFRSGSHSISTVLLIFNLIVSLGIFLAISANADYYQNSMKADLLATMEEVTLSEISNSGNIPEAQLETLKDQIKQKTYDLFSNSLVMQSLVKFLPLTIAFSAWAFLELLRMLILPNVGGIITYVLIKINR
jgi:Zn-dependent protease